MRANFLDRGFGINRTWVAVAIGGSAVIGAGASMYSSSQASKSGKNASQALTQLGNEEIAKYGTMSPEEQAQYDQSFSTGQVLSDYEKSQLQGTPEQQYQRSGPLAQSLYNTGLSQAQNPTAGWNNALQPQLQQAQEQINNYYNQRGLINSGIAIGSMGTAGVDLAIQNAQNEMTYQQQSLQNAQSIQQNAQGYGQQNLSNLASLNQNQQQMGLQNKQLAEGAYANALGIQAYPMQAQLGAAYGQQAGSQANMGNLIGAGGQIGSSYMMSQALNKYGGGGSLGGNFQTLGAAEANTPGLTFAAA